MAHKTKAALQSCQCHYEIFKQSQNITLIMMVNYRAKFCAQWAIGSLRNISHPPHPFGSIPFLRRASRPNSFIQFARLTLSAWASFSNCSLSSGFIRMWNGGDFPPPLDWLSRVDMCTPMGIWLFIGVHLNMYEPKKTTPRTVEAVPRRLTTT